MRNNILIIIFFAALLAPFALRAQPVVLKADSVTVPCHATDTFLIPLRLDHFTNVAGMQFTFSWNPAYLDYTYISDVNPAFQGIGFDTTTFINQGKFTFTWTNSNGVTLPDSSVLLKVAFVRIGGPASLVEYTNVPTDIVIIDPLGNDLMVQTVPGLVDPVDNLPPSIGCPSDVLMQVTGPTAVNGIAPVPPPSDNCSIFSTGWTSTGATAASFPTDPDASGAIFNIGQSTVTYTTTDVGGNTATCSFLVNLELMPGDSLTLIASNENVACGQTVKVDITALNFDSIAGLQFSLGWDPAVLGYVSVGDFNPALQLSASNFGDAQTGSGFLGFAWTTNDLFGGTTIPNGEVLFSLTFNLLATGNTTTNVQFGDVPTAQAAFKAPADEIGFITVNGIVTVADDEPPVIQCPSNVTVMAPTGSTSATVNGLEPLVLTDNCGGNINLSYQQSGATTGQGQGAANGMYNAISTNVVYTATDASGNTATCQFTVNVDAGTPLTLQLDTIAIDCQVDTGRIAINLTVQDFNDIIGLQFNITWDTSVLTFDTVENYFPGLNLTNSMFFGFHPSVDTGTLRFFGGNAGGWPQIPDGGTFFTIYFYVNGANVATDLLFTGVIDAVNASFSSVPVQTFGGYFFSEDQTPPSILCPENISVSLTGNECDVNVALDTATAADACSGIQSIGNDQTDDIFSAGVTVVTYTAIDDVGNAASCTMTVTVIDNTPPEIFNCPADVSVDAAQNCEAAVNWEAPTATDACTPDPPPVVVPSADPGSVFPIGDSLVVYTATDAFGNSTTCSFTVSVRDTVQPTIICPGDFTVTSDTTCSAVATWSVPIALDNCDTDVAIASDSLPGAVFPAGTTVVTYSATDDYGNQSFCSFSITVVDLNPPVLDTCPPSVTVSAAQDDCSALVNWASPNATDDCSANVTVTASHPPGSPFQVGTTVVVYTASDIGNNSATCSFSVTVEEIVPPVIQNCPTGFVFDMPADQCDTLVSWTPPTATDNCALDTLTGSAMPGTVFGTGTHTVVYTAVDDAGNTATCVFIIAVNDNFPPVLANCPEDSTFSGPNITPCGVLYDWQWPDISDNCAIADTQSTKPQGDLFFPGITNVVLQATDNSGNSTTCSFTVTVLPTSSQMFTGFPEDIVLPGCPQTVTWTPPGTTGFCVDPVITVIPDTIQPGDMFPFGTTDIIYIATDTSGVQIRDTFSVTIVDNVQPILSCPSEPILVSVGGVVLNGSDPTGFIDEVSAGQDCAGVQLFFTEPAAIDNCSDPVVVQTAGEFSGFDFAVDSTHTLVFVASDDAGNTSECSVAITVSPLTAPEVEGELLACLDSFVLLTVADTIDGATYTWTTPSGSTSTGSIREVIASVNNAGLHTVTYSLNGCTSDTAAVNLQVAFVKAIADTVTISLDGIPDTIDVLANDIILPPGDFTIQLTTNLPEALDTVPGHPGLFIYNDNGVYDDVEFFYRLCSRTCPNSCSDTLARVTIRPNEQECSFIPNIITPNGDPHNEYFLIPCIESGGFPRNSLVVYNQWGDKVFEASPYQNNWMGTLDGELGKDLPDGVYFYVFKPDPNAPPQKGFVQIYR